MSAVNIFEDGPIYYEEDAVNFIRNATNIDEELIRKVLEAEEDYMRSIGLIVELGGD